MHKVITRDVDGASTRRYKTLAAAVARFTEMLGYSPQAALDSHCDLLSAVAAPRFENVSRVRGVSDYGTVVIIEVDRSIL